MGKSRVFFLLAVSREEARIKRPNRPVVIFIYTFIIIAALIFVFRFFFLVVAAFVFNPMGETMCCTRCRTYRALHETYRHACRARVYV